MKKIMILPSLMFVLMTLPACAGPLRYSAAPIEAWVVDKETSQPLEGVVVVAHWALESTSRIIPHQTNSAGSLMILETVTDKDGRFYFPAWGPKWHLGSGELTDSDPELILFKSGYMYLLVSNSQYLRPSKYSDVGKPSGTESKPTGSKRISFWSGERIKLEKFKGTTEKYARHLGFMTTSLESILSEECGWKKIPRMILALNGQSEIFRKHELFELPSVDSLEVRYSNFKSQCGSVKEYFRNYQP